jgi:hypothetical protein
MLDVGCWLDDNVFIFIFYDLNVYDVFSISSGIVSFYSSSGSSSPSYGNDTSREVRYNFLLYDRKLISICTTSVAER